MTPPDLPIVTLVAVTLSGELLRLAGFGCKDVSNEIHNGAPFWCGRRAYSLPIHWSWIDDTVHFLASTRLDRWLVGAQFPFPHPTRGHHQTSQSRVYIHEAGVERPAGSTARRNAPAEAVKTE